MNAASDQAPVAAFWSRASTDPGAVAVVAPDGTAREAGALLEASNRLAHGLEARGLSRGAILAVALGDGVAFLEAYLAAMQAGWHFAPLPPALTPPELRAILEDCRPQALLFDAGARDAVLRSGHDPRRCFSLEAEPGFASLADVREGQPATPPPARSLGAKLFYTSGTTGRPSGIVSPLAEADPEACGAAAAAHLFAVAGITPSRDAAHLVASPLYHSASLLWATDSLHLGHRVVLLGAFDPEGALERIARHRVTSTFMVPTHFHRLLALPEEIRRRHATGSLRHVVHGGAPCPVELKRRMIEWWGPVITEVYGAAEGGGVAIGPEEWLRKPGSVGRPGADILVLAEDGSECAPGETGQVWIRRRRPFAYLNDPARTEARRRGEHFTVGDLGRKDGDGYLFLSGRLEDRIKSGGVNVDPAEVEARLRQHAAVADVAVFGLADPEWGERVCAAVVLAAGHAGSPVLEESLRAHCRQGLAGAKVPRRLLFFDRLPAAANGKLSRRSLAAAAAQGAGGAP